MKVDTYTKGMLTIIALCLVVLVFKDTSIIPTAHADESNVKSFSTANYGLVPMNEDGSINVVIKSIAPNSTMDVNIKEIDTYDELNVNIDEIGGSSVSSGGPIKVKID